MKVPKPEKKEKKKRKKGKSQLEKTDEAFRKLVRIKSNLRGIKHCSSCGGDVEYGTYDYQAGHYLSCKIFKYRYDERNVNIQCYKCNIVEKGAIQAYSFFIREEYGNEFLTELDEYYRAVQTGKILQKRPSVEELKELEIIYKKEIKKLEGKL